MKAMQVSVRAQRGVGGGGGRKAEREGGREEGRGGRKGGGGRAGGRERDRELTRKGTGITGQRAQTNKTMQIKQNHINQTKPYNRTAAQSTSQENHGTRSAWVSCRTVDSSSLREGGGGGGYLPVLLYASGLAC